MRTRFHTTIDKDLKLQIQVRATQEGRNVNDILEELISQYLDKEVSSNECDKQPNVKTSKA